MAKVKVHVAIVNNLPVAQPDTYNVRFDSIGNSLRVLDNDTFAPDVGETLTITDVGVPDSGGVVTIANAGQTLRYSPATGFRGTERFTYTINDSRGGTATADITINVGDFNGPPTADPDAFTLRQNSTNNVLNVLANDFDPDGGDPLSITNLTAPTGGGIAVISLDKGSVIYSTPRPFLGTDTFMYTVSDGHGGSSQALVTITVRGWQNPLNPLDVDRDTHANTATDANIIITELNARTFIAVDGLLPEAPDSPLYFYDTSGDGYLTSLDALLIINALNLQGSGSGGAEGEGASAFVVSALSTNSADAVAPAPSPSAFAASSDLECTLAEIACDVSLARQKRLFGRR